MNSQVGMPVANPTSPRKAGDLVSSKTRNPRAVDSIHTPKRETIWLQNQSR
jgi:hypothetical protein